MKNSDPNHPKVIYMYVAYWLFYVPPKLMGSIALISLGSLWTHFNFLYEWVFDVTADGRNVFYIMTFIVGHRIERLYYE